MNFNWLYIKKDTLKFIALAVLAVATIFVGFYFGVDDLRPEVVRSWVADHGILAPIFYIMIFTIAAATLLPGTPVAIAGGALFGWFEGSIYTVIGAVIGALITFWTSRLLGEDFVSRFVKENEMKKIDSYKGVIERKSFMSVIILRLIPLVPFTVLSMFLGLTKIKTPKFFWGTLLGIIPGTFAYVYFGQSLFSLEPAKTIIAIVILIALSSLAYFGKRFLSRGQKEL